MIVCAHTGKAGALQACLTRGAHQTRPSAASMPNPICSASKSAPITRDDPLTCSQDGPCGLLRHVLNETVGMPHWALHKFRIFGNLGLWADQISTLKQHDIQLNLRYFQKVRREGPWCTEA